MYYPTTSVAAKKHVVITVQILRPHVTWSNQPCTLTLEAWLARLPHTFSNLVPFDLPYHGEGEVKLFSAIYVGSHLCWVSALEFFMFKLDSVESCE